jgi:hypothetical protein
VDWLYDWMHPISVEDLFQLSSDAMTESTARVWRDSIGRSSEIMTQGVDLYLYLSPSTNWSIEVMSNRNNLRKREGKVMQQKVSNTSETRRLCEGMFM